jgi:DNA-binding transcriptional MerR regulator
LAEVEKGSRRGEYSIGEVLNRLKVEFPDVTISKIRFLESKGLISPARTASGYRVFNDEDIERLRWILTQQRTSYLPLRVLKAQLDGDPPPQPGQARRGRHGPLGAKEPLPLDAARSARWGGEGQVEALGPVPETEGGNRPGAMQSRESQGGAGLVSRSMPPPSHQPANQVADTGLAPSRRLEHGFKVIDDVSSGSWEGSGPASERRQAAAEAERSGRPGAEPDGEDNRRRALQLESEAREFGFIGKTGRELPEEIESGILDALERLGQAGVRPRHLQFMRYAAKRQAALIEAAVSPLRRRRDPATKEKVEELVRSASAAFEALARALLRRELGG